MNDLQRWFERTALDPEFRELARRDPKASFTGYDLTPEQRTILIRQDETLMGLLASALADLEPPSESVAEAPDTDGARPPAPALPGTLLYLRLVPQVAANGAVQHAASLHTTSEEAATAENGTVFVIHIAPLTRLRDDGQITLAYDATLSRLDEAPAEASPPPGQRAYSGNARGAAAAVLQAAPADRRSKLMELVEALDA